MLKMKLIMPILLGSMMLPPRVMVPYVVVNLVGMLFLLPRFIPGVTTTQVILEPVSFVAIGGTLAMLFTQYRTRLAGYRRARLAESERRYRGLFEAVFDGIVTYEHERVLEANPRVARMFGYDRQEPIGRLVSDLVSPVSQDLIMEEVESGQPHEVVGIRKDGSTFAAEIIIRAQAYRGREVYVMAIRDITRRKRAEEAQRRYAERLEASLQEKEVLLKEIHHRVKNNLQVIASLLYLQSKNIKDKETFEMFQDSQSRVRSMALVHERLYQSQDLARVDFAEYVRSLANQLLRSYGVSTSVIQLKINMDKVFLGVDTAIPCGLMINELVSNSLKHAFSDGREGEVRIALRSDGGQFILVVSDDGIGFPEGLDFRDMGSLGLQLVDTLVNQLEGTIELDRSGGTAFKITFAESRY